MSKCNVAYPFREVERVTVVGVQGRVYEASDLYPGGCYVTIQDEGKTLKILPLEPNVRDVDEATTGDAINPDYYKRGGLEAIYAIEAFFMHSPHLANAFKYLVRMGEKPGNSVRQDADKAKWYIDRWVSVQDK